ncbi:MAG TPA: hypothetical protein VF828_03905 [Patescibacteria group bacterium]
MKKTPILALSFFILLLAIAASDSAFSTVFAKDTPVSKPTIVTFSPVSAKNTNVTAKPASVTGTETNGTEVSTDGGKVKTAPPRSSTALEHMSAVASKVQELLTTQGAKGGIGTSISLFASQQKKTDDEVKQSMDKVDSRPKLLRQLIGPDYASLADLQNKIKQYEANIELLTQIKSSNKDKTLEPELQATLDSLTQEKASVQNYVNQQGHLRSLFGWFFKFFAK